MSAKTIPLLKGLNPVDPGSRVCRLIAGTCCALSLSCYPLISSAQNENNNWCFGYNTGLTFNVNPPVFFTDSMQTAEGSSGVSDANGNLLFYTSGFRVWNKNHLPMPNGTGLFGNGPVFAGVPVGSSGEGVAIVQSPSNSHQYYIVCTSANEDSTHNAYYSLVDMTLDNGLGDVVPGMKNMVLASEIGEGVITARGAGCSYWVVIHSLLSMNYLAFKVDQGGMAAVPVSSPGLLGMMGNNYYGGSGMCINPANNRLVKCTATGVETASFNNTTGVLSDFTTLDAALTGGYPVFAPDGLKLYIGAPTGFFQYNTGLLPNVAAMQSSKTVIGTGSFRGSRRAPDGRIYTIQGTLNSASPQTIGRVENPDNAGIACNYVPSAIAIPAPYSSNFMHELGSPVLIDPQDTIFNAVTDTTVCFGQSLTLQADTAYEYQTWNTGSTAGEIVVTQPGDYWVYGFKNCSTYIDSFHISWPDFSVSLGNDTTICKNIALLLDATVPGNASYLWQDGAASATYTVNSSGLYTVLVTRNGCTLSDSIAVTTIQPFLNIAEADTTLCQGEQFTLHASSFPAGSYTWNTGSTSSETAFTGEGSYRVTATNICGTFSDSIYIRAKDCPCLVFVPNAFSPNGDGKNDMLRANISCYRMSAFHFTIYNRYGQKVFDTKQPEQAWDGSFHGIHADVNTYFFYLSYKDDLKNITVTKKGDITLIR